MHRLLTTISGPSGSGKTTLCLRLAEQALLVDLDCAGLISPARFEGDRKTGIDLLDVRSLARQPLAHLDTVPGKLRTGAFRFDLDTVQWGVQLLKTACPCDVLIIDELGPLELERGQGWTNAIQVVGSAQFQLAVVVVRPNLIQDFRHFLGSGRPTFRSESTLVLPDLDAERQAFQQIKQLSSKRPG
jgi:nucleoside-triphosphatase